MTKFNAGIPFPQDMLFDGSLQPKSISDAYAELENLHKVLDEIKALGDKQSLLGLKKLTKRCKQLLKEK